MRDKIGTAAGKIWHHLNTSKAPQPLDKIRKATDLTPVVATAAVGWLSCQDKVSIVETADGDKNPVVSLNGK
jgi:hypothetical protein